MKDLSLETMLEGINECRKFRNLPIWKIKTSKLTVKQPNIRYYVTQGNVKSGPFDETNVWSFLRGALRMHNDIRLKEIKESKN